MRRFGAGLILALAVLCSAVRVSRQPLTESEVWQDTDRVEALRRMTAAAAHICAPAGWQMQFMTPLSEAEREFVSTVHLLIRATLAGVYGHDTPFWLEG